jgi:hypothetical protein
LLVLACRAPWLSWLFSTRRLIVKLSP